MADTNTNTNNSTSTYHIRNSRARLGLKTSVGEIVEVQGGHIIRSTGRKDRHSKVCTAKGPRDRRVRLAAHTAIQFYDVQDRLGYDRPSKAVDWLITKAQAAIDELAELPPWHPTTGLNVNNNNHNNFGNHDHEEVQKKIEEDDEENERNNMEGLQSSSFLHTIGTSSLDDDTMMMKSFFPATTNSSTMQYEGHNNNNCTTNHDHHHNHNHSSQFQDLRLSLHSFQDPMLLEHQNPHSSHVLLNGTPIGYDTNAAAWFDQQHHNQGNGDATAGYLFNSGSQVSSSSSSQPLLQQLLGAGHSQFYSQRGPLQSINNNTTCSIRGWNIDHSSGVPDHHYAQASMPMYASSLHGGGFHGFRIPARIQGDDDDHEHDGYSDKPSSGSSDSRH